MKQESLFEKVSQLLEKVVVPSVEAQRRITQKRIHLRTNPDETEIHRGLVQWTTFRPSLLPVNPGVVEPVAADFKKRMAEALKKGGSDQFDLINTSMSKIMFHSLKIQQLVEGVVQKSEPLLTSNAASPYLENACCHDGAIHPIKYFVENASDISTHNDNALALQNLLMDVRRMGQPSILFDASNTKYRRAPPVEDYSEETIYRAFIHYCRYNSKIPMGEEVRAICSEKPAEFDNSEPFEEQIRKLKRDGYNYNSESLHQLMSIVYRKNIQPLSRTGGMDVLSIHVVQSLIESMDDSLIPRAFKEHFEKMVEHGESEVRAMKNYLGTQNEFMINQIERFFLAYGVNTSLLSGFNTLCSLSYFTRVLPNIVANKVDYSDIDPPKHWKLSQRHKGDFRNFMNKYYIKIYKLFDDEEARSILLRVREVTADFETLWSHAAIVDEQMETLLRQFYFMVVLTEYIEPGNDTNEYLNNDDDESEIVDGDREKRNQKVALILESFGKLLISEMETVNFTYDSLMERVHRAKEKEKDDMTDYLRDMTDEQREIENLLKNNRLGSWSKGLQKGLREYQQGTYDEEREAMDKQAIAELRAGEKNVITEMNRDIYAMDYIAEEHAAQQIEADEMRLDHLGEDDDYGELDGDENY